MSNIVQVYLDNRIRDARIDFTEVNRAFEYFSQHGKMENGKVFVEYFNKLIEILKSLDNEATDTLRMAEGKGWYYTYTYDTGETYNYYIKSNPVIIQKMLLPKIYDRIWKLRHNKRLMIQEKREKKFLESLTPLQIRQMKNLKWGPYFDWNSV